MGSIQLVEGGNVIKAVGGSCNIKVQFLIEKSTLYYCLTSIKVKRLDDRISYNRFTINYY